MIVFLCIGNDVAESVYLSRIATYMIIIAFNGDLLLFYAVNKLFAVVVIQRPTERLSNGLLFCTEFSKHQRFARYRPSGVIGIFSLT